MNQTKYYNLFKLYQGTYLSNLKYLNKNMDIIDEALHNASPSSAGVQDVKVDGISVVTNHIANVDLTSYAKTADLVYKQDKLTAGANIHIDGNNVISATDTTYTAGTGITIENNVISATGGGGHGLEYWTETSESISREINQTIYDFSCDAQFLVENGVNIIYTSPYYSPRKYTSSGKAVGALGHYYDGGENPENGFVLFSTDADAVKVLAKLNGLSPQRNEAVAISYKGHTIYTNGQIYNAASNTTIAETSGLVDVGTFDSYSEFVNYVLNNSGLEIHTELLKQTGIGVGDKVVWGGNRYSASDEYPFYATDNGLVYGKKHISKGIHDGISGLANYLKPSNNEIGYYESGAGWDRSIIVRLKGNTRNVIIGITWQQGNRHPLICFASQDSLDFEWGYSNNTFQPPYGVAEWQNKSSYPVPTSGYDWYFGYSFATTTYEGNEWNVLLVDCLYWDGGDGYSSTLGIAEFSKGKWGNKPDVSLVGYDLLETANAKPYTEVVSEIGTQTYAFKYGNDDALFTYIDIDGNALFKEITTDAGSLTSQMAQKQNLLTAGENIQINGDIISATDTDEISELSDVNLTNIADGEVLKYDATNQEWVNATGGTNVEANPSGSASATLNKVAIDNVIYSLPSGGGGGGSFVGLTKSQYDALPTADKEDTSKLYFVQEGGGQIETTDLIGVSSDWGMYREGSMTITWNNDEIVFDWLGGSAIGGDIVKIAVIPASASKIRFKITTGSAYSTNTQRFKLGVGVRTTYTTSVVLDGYNVSDWLAFKNFETINSVWEDELDLSNVTVDTYLYIIAHGWDATINKLEMVTADSSEATYHTYWNNAKRAQWNQIKELAQAEYNALSTDEKQNGNLYLTHDDGYDFISYDNGKIVVRVNNSTGQTLWFFNGFYKDSSDLTVPAELLPYVPTQTSAINVMQAKSWTDDTSTSTNGWVGFLYPGTANVKIRSWTSNFTQLTAGTFWAVLDIDGSTAEGGQTAPYSSPYDGVGITPNRIYYNNTLYAEKQLSNQITYGTIAPTGSANDGDLYILLDNNNNKIGEYLYEINAWVQIE